MGVVVRRLCALRVYIYTFVVENSNNFYAPLIEIPHIQNFNERYSNATDAVLNRGVLTYDAYQSQFCDFMNKAKSSISKYAFLNLMVILLHVMNWV